MCLLLCSNPLHQLWAGLTRRRALQALASMEEAWGRPASQVFVSISPTPVAAASLGQARPRLSICHRNLSLVRAE